MGELYKQRGRLRVVHSFTPRAIHDPGCIASFASFARFCYDFPTLASDRGLGPSRFLQ